MGVFSFVIFYLKIREGGFQLSRDASTAPNLSIEGPCELRGEDEAAY